MPMILTVNAGSSTIKFAAFEPAGDERMRRLFEGLVDRAGSAGASLTAKFFDGSADERHDIDASGSDRGAAALLDWLRRRIGDRPVLGIGHRVVHGGLTLTDHCLITNDAMTKLREAQPLDLAHLPHEIRLIEAFEAGFPGVPQAACFDTAFHRDLPRVAQLLPIPRRFTDAGIRRFGFHGLSYTYLLDELRRIADSRVAGGRVILAHLGSGASMVAVRDGRPIDTSMAFTPTAGLVMGTRPGDLDPGLLVHLMRQEKLSPEDADNLVNRECGLFGVSNTTSDMRDLLARRSQDARAAEAVELFCYQARKFIGAYAAAMGGLDTLVFSGGVGEHAVEVREQICVGLGFLGINLDPRRNGASESIISADGTDVTVRVIKTDEEAVIAQVVMQLVHPR